MSWNVNCQPGYVAEESIVAVIDGVSDRWETTSEITLFGVNWCHLICSNCLWHFIWKASRVQELNERMVQVLHACNIPQGTQLSHQSIAWSTTKQSVAMPPSSRYSGALCHFCHFCCQNWFYWLFGLVGAQISQKYWGSIFPTSRPHFMPPFSKRLAPS